MTAPPIRSYLFVPATRPERIPKARSSGAGAVIVDLEDAVAPQDKASARAALGTARSSGAGLLVRVNGAETDWFEADLQVCAALGVDGIVLPKAERAEVIRHAAARLGPGAVVLPIVESAQGYAALAELCAAPQVERVAFGSIDFQLDLGIEGEDEQLAFFRSGIVLASRLAGRQPPVDGVTVEIGDIERLRADTLRGKRMGFGAKLCIHPGQVACVNACFAPSAEEVAWARRVVAAASAVGNAAVALDGKMVDRPVIVKAERILAEAQEGTK
jgi:citrate lyase subunit beta/citryl-CoA lyase